MMRKPSRRKLSTCSGGDVVEGGALRDGRRHAGTVPAHGRAQQAAARRLPRVGRGGARRRRVGGARPRWRRRSPRRWWRWRPALRLRRRRLVALRPPAEQAGALRARALRLAQEELSSYAPVLEARDEHERELALAAASEPPAHIAEVAAEVAELGAEVAASASPSVRGDALTGVVLAEAAASAAFRLVEINVGSRPGVRARPRGRTTSGEGAGNRHGPATATAARADPALRFPPARSAGVSGSGGPFRRCRSRRGRSPRGGSPRIRAGPRAGRGSGRRSKTRS